MSRPQVFLDNDLEGAAPAIPQQHQRHVQVLRAWGDIQSGLVGYRSRKLRWVFEMAPRKLLMMCLSFAAFGYAMGWFTPEAIVFDSESPVEKETHDREAEQTGQNFTRDFALVVLVGYSLLRELKAWNRVTNYTKLEKIFTKEKATRLVTSHQAELLHPRDEDMMQLVDGFNNTFTGPMPFVKLHHPLKAFLKRFPYDPESAEYLHWRYEPVAQPPPPPPLPAGDSAPYRPAVPGNQERAQQMLNQAELVARIAQAFSLRHRADENAAFMPQVTRPDEMHRLRNHGAELRRIEAEFTGAATSSSSDNGGEGPSAPGDAGASDVELRPLQHAAPDLAPPAARQYFSFQENLNHLTLFLLGDIYQQLECAGGVVGLGDFVIFLGELLQDSDCFTVLNSEAQTPLAGRGLQLACLFTGVTVTGLFLERTSYIAIGTDDDVSQFRVRAFKQLYPGIWRRIASTCCVSNHSKIMPASLIFTLMSSHEIADLNPGRLVALSILRRSPEFTVQDQAAFFALYLGAFEHTPHGVQLGNQLIWLLKQTEMRWQEFANYDPALFARILGFASLHLTDPDAPPPPNDDADNDDAPPDDGDEFARIAEQNSMTHQQFFNLVWDGGVTAETRQILFDTLPPLAQLVLLNTDDSESFHQLQQAGLDLFKPMLESEHQALVQQAAEVLVRIVTAYPVLVAEPAVVQAVPDADALFWRFLNRHYPGRYGYEPRFPVPDTFGDHRVFRRVYALMEAVLTSGNTLSVETVSAMLIEFQQYLVADAARAQRMLMVRGDAYAVKDYLFNRLAESIREYALPFFITDQHGDFLSGSLRANLIDLLVNRHCFELGRLTGPNILGDPLIEIERARDLEGAADRAVLKRRLYQRPIASIALIFPLLAIPANRTMLQIIMEQYAAGFSEYLINGAPLSDYTPVAISMLAASYVGYPVPPNETLPDLVGAALANPDTESNINTLICRHTALLQFLHYTLWYADTLGGEVFKNLAPTFRLICEGLLPLHPEPDNIGTPMTYLLGAMQHFIELNELPGGEFDPADGAATALADRVTHRMIALYVYHYYRDTGLVTLGCCGSPNRANTVRAMETLFEWFDITDVDQPDGAAPQYSNFLRAVEAGSDALGLGINTKYIRWARADALAGVVPAADEEAGLLVGGRRRVSTRTRQITHDFAHHGDPADGEEEDFLYHASPGGGRAAGGS